MSTLDGRATTASETPVSPTVERIRQCAIELFATLGYHGTSVRDIAQKSEISIATLFHHYHAKYEILRIIIVDTMESLIEATERACAEAPGDPISQLAAAVEAHVRFHTERQAESFIGNSELRSLTPDDLETIIGLRDRQQRIIDAAVSAGCASGVFSTPYPREAGRAIVTMSTAVAAWFRPSGALSAEEVAHIHSELALELAGRRNKTPPRRRTPKTGNVGAA